MKYHMRQWKLTVKRRLQPTATYRFLAKVKDKIIFRLQKIGSVPQSAAKYIRKGLKSGIVWMLDTPLYHVASFCAFGPTFYRLLKKRRSMPRTTVSIIIPTHRPNDYLHKAVSSALDQDCSLCDIEVIICVNGDRGYYEQVLSQFSTEPEIRVLYTPVQSLGAARNLGVQHAQGAYFTFLDDDDYFTKHYIRNLLAYAQEGTSIVCGLMIDLDMCTGKRIYSTYINRAVLQGPYCERTRFRSSVLTTLAGKLYERDAYNTFLPIDESLRNTEDVLFWAQNVGRIQGNIAAMQYSSREAYVRRLTAGSMSRPDTDSYRFYVTERLQMIARIEGLMFCELPLWHNRFLLQKIISQFGHIARYYDTLPKGSSLRPMVQEAVRDSKSMFVNTSLLSETEGIAFCHNFVPAVDPSAYVAAKRLPKIAELFGEPIHWTVISSDCPFRDVDNTFDEFYARQQYAKHIVIHFGKLFDVSGQAKWAEEAVKKARGLEPAVMYSRSMWIGSHIAALMYRKNHPNVKWYAEFSDPVYIATNGKPRLCGITEDPDSWLKIEYEVMCQADELIFTNENQLTYMLEHNDLVTDKEEILRKSRVCRHPILPERFTRLMSSDIQLSADRINVGYFGTFYPARNSTDLLKLLRRDNVEVYIFTPQKVREIPKEYRPFLQRLHWCGTMDHMMFLNAASKFDYLFLSDMEFDGDINPYLPSKLADYLVTGTPILAKVEDGSAMSKIHKPQMIQFHEIDDHLLDSLQKRERSLRN